MGDPGRAGDADLFDRAPVGYVVLDDEQRLLRANRAFLRLVGLTREQAVGERTFPSFVSVAGRIYYETHLQPALDLDRGFHEVALDVVRPDGTRVPVLVSANRDRGITRVVVFEARHRRSYEGDLLQATRAAERAEAAATALARGLQQTLIPPTSPQIPGLTVAAAYRPAGDGSVVGGDFYDVFQVADDCWVVVLGDVSGKGIAAATLTAFIRHRVRELSMQVPDPAALLTELNAAMVAHDTTHFCTLVVARFTRIGDAWRVCLSLGGHPPVLSRSPDGSVTELGEAGSLVGIFDAPSFQTVEHDLADTTLAFFTDGVTEARADGAVLGEERLAELVRGPAGADAAGLAGAIVAAALEFQGGDAADDIAVVTISSVPGPPVAGT